MIETFFAFLRYFVALLFGVLIAFRFVGLPYTKKNNYALAVFIASVFIVEVLCLLLFGIEQTLKIYPLISHVPILLLLALYFKKSWLISFTSSIVAFLCCQPLRWVGTLFGELFNRPTMNHIGYILAALILYTLIEKYARDSIEHLMSRSVRSCLLLAAMPTFYYIFEYSTSVYTQFLYSGERIVIQFMPFITATFYLLFVLLYYEEAKKQLHTQRHLHMVEAQFKQAQKELASLKHMHQQAASYRHDLRHHLALLQTMALNGHMEDIRHYLHTVQSDLEAITPIRYCDNDTVNLILSSFAAKATAAEIVFTIETRLPEQLPFSPTELCSLLSNAFENALHACSAIQNKDARWIKLRIFAKNNKLCIDIQNSYQTEPVFDNGLPISCEEAHGFGTKSMAHLVERYGGVYRFSASEHTFIFQATV